MKKLFAGILAVAIATSFMGCGSNNTSSESSSGDNRAFVGSKNDEYYMVTFLSGIDHWKGIYAGMKDAGDKLGVTTKYTGQIDTDVAGQVAVLEQVVAQNPKGIALTSANSVALTDTINAAKKQGISVVTFDSDSPESNRTAYLAMSNYDAGKSAAEYLSSLINKKGKVAVLFTIGQENTENRANGFEDWCKVNAPEISIVKVNDAGDTMVATDNMSAALQANNDFVALFCANGIAATAGPTAVAEAGRKNMKILAFDTDISVLDKIKTGEIDATVSQGTYNMGYWSMMFLYAESQGLIQKPLPGYVDTGITIVTKENVSEFYF
ncbi:MAG: substrate-binding domain-containing protein [Treponemataceae bacterium]